MNKYHFNEHKQDIWKCDWLIGHIISINWLKEWDVMKSLDKVLEISKKELPMISTRISTNLSDRLGFDTWPNRESFTSLMWIKDYTYMVIDDGKVP